MLVRGMLIFRKINLMIYQEKKLIWITLAAGLKKEIEVFKSKIGSKIKDHIKSFSKKDILDKLFEAIMLWLLENFVMYPFY